MIPDTVAQAAGMARAKAELLRKHPLGYLVLSVLAGAYVGFGIALVFAVGAPLAADGSPLVKLLMGASFGVALSPVIMAGAELFTGNNLVMAVGVARRATGLGDLVGVWALSYAGNLVGSLALAWLVAESGVLGASPQLEFVQKAVAAKMSLSFGELFSRGILANWLVCLAVWSAMRATSDAGKLVMIWWCLFAFVGPGFEHSIANMTLLGIGLFQPHGPEISWAGFVHNLVPVTLGNIVGGALFVGMAYWIAAHPGALPRLGASGSAAARAAESGD